MTDTENGKAKAKTERLGIVPMAKLATVVPPKVWDGHKKNLQALADAKASTAISKQAVLVALSKELKLDDASSLTFWADADKLVIGRRPKEKQARRQVAALRDLTA